jgi:septum formation protein
LVPRALVLASKSPQRKALLEALGLEFDVIVPEIEELVGGEPHELVRANALAKAHAVAAIAEPGTTVIAGDTEVVAGGRALGQPADEAQAREYLEDLSGRRHEVLGGIAVIASDEELVGVEVSRVRFRELSEAEINAYVASGEWHGRAGGYAIQGLGSALVEEVRGDLSNVIGLPVALLLRLAPEILSQP